jgi:hypothetical protein
VLQQQTNIPVIYSVIFEGVSCLEEPGLREKVLIEAFGMEFVVIFRKFAKCNAKLLETSN